MIPTIRWAIPLWNLLNLPQWSQYFLIKCQESRFIGGDLLIIKRNIGWMWDSNTLHECAEKHLLILPEGKTLWRKFNSKRRSKYRSQTMKYRGDHTAGVSKANVLWREERKHSKIPWWTDDHGFEIGMEEFAARRDIDGDIWKRAQILLDAFLSTEWQNPGNETSIKNLGSSLITTHIGLFHCQRSNV